MFQLTQNLGGSNYRVGSENLASRDFFPADTKGLANELRVLNKPRGPFAIGRTVDAHIIPMVTVFQYEEMCFGGIGNRRSLRRSLYCGDHRNFFT